LLGKLRWDKNNPADPAQHNITSVAVAWPMRLGALVLIMVELSNLLSLPKGPAFLLRRIPTQAAVACGETLTFHCESTA